MRRLVICTSWLICSFGYDAYGQENSLSKKLTLYSQATRQEEIILITNASLFLTGETLLFKAHCRTISDGLASVLSRIAYVELIDANRQPVLQTKIMLAGGMGYGEFFLPSTLTTGNYVLICYTKWMLNESVANFSKTGITIINPFRKPATVAGASADVKFSFSPAGGKLVSGVENNVSFVAVDGFGRPVNVSGTVIDDAGNTVSMVKSSSRGKGAFSITPLEGKTYKAVLTDSLKRVYLPLLPSVASDGVTVQWQEVDDLFIVSLKKNQRAPLSKINWLLHAKGVPVREGTITFIEDAARMDVTKADLPECSYLTFFDQEKVAFAEVSLPGRVQETKKLSVSIDAAVYKTRKKVGLVLEGPLSNVSISVRLVENMRTAKLLSGADSHPHRSGKIAPRWSAVFGNRKPLLILPDMRGDLINGRLLDPSGKAIRNEPVFLSIPSTEFLFTASKTDSAGRFYFNSDRPYPSREIFFNVKSGDSLRAGIKLDSDFADQYEGISPYPVRIDSADRGAIERRSVYTQLENAYFEFKKDSIQAAPYSRFYGTPDEVYLLDDYSRFPTMEDVLREYVTSVIVRKRGGHFTLKALGRRTSLPFKADPLILLDGVPVFNNDLLMNYDPLKIKKIEVVMRRYFYGPLDVSGIISFVTYDGEAKGIPSLASVQYVGVQALKSYFTVNHSMESGNRLPDYRIQLYWNPSVALSGSQKLEFYTSDIPGDYEVVVEGIQLDGQWVRGSAVFRVEE